MPRTTSTVLVDQPSQWDRAISDVTRCRMEPTENGTKHASHQLELSYTVTDYAATVRLESDDHPSVSCDCRRGHEGKACAHAAAALVTMTPLHRAWPGIRADKGGWVFTDLTS